MVSWSGLRIQRQWKAQRRSFENGILSSLSSCRPSDALSSVASREKTLLVPDKDADGLDAGAIIYKTLVSLGLERSSIDVHLVGKNCSVHDEVERKAMAAKDPRYIIVVDQGSRAAPSLVEDHSTKSLVIDHHLSDDFPENATV